MTLESREYLLRVPKDHCGGRSHLDIYGKVGFSAQCANKSLASEETALHGTFHYFCENVLWQQFLLCTPLFVISTWRFFFLFLLHLAIAELGRSQIRVFPVVRDSTPCWNPAAFMGFPFETLFSRGDKWFSGGRSSGKF